MLSKTPDNHYRHPTRAELTLIRRAFDKFGIFEKMNQFSILIQEGQNRGVSVCITSSKLADMVSRFRPMIAGLEIGNLTKQFAPNIAGADLFARLGGKGRQYVTINDEAEALVLYGRDVLGKSIVSASPDLEENEIVILLNVRGSAVGIGRTRYPGALLTDRPTATISTISDAGEYLRNEDKIA